MKKELVFKILGGFVGLIAGTLAGAFIGLVIGGTFLGGFDIYENIGIEGYELSAYVGSIIGLVVGMIKGIKIGVRIANKPKETK